MNTEMEDTGRRPRLKWTRFWPSGDSSTTSSSSLTSINVTDKEYTPKLLTDYSPYMLDIGWTFWAALRALVIGLILIVVGIAMTVLSFFDHALAYDEILMPDNSTMPVVNEQRMTSVKALGYIGPVIMGCGTFILMIACVMTLENRDKHAQVFEKPITRKRQETAAASEILGSLKSLSIGKKTPDSKRTAKKNQPENTSMNDGVEDIHIERSAFDGPNRADSQLSLLDEMVCDDMNGELQHCREHYMQQNLHELHNERGFYSSQETDTGALMERFLDDQSRAVDVFRTDSANDSTATDTVVEIHPLPELALNTVASSNRLRVSPRAKLASVESDISNLTGSIMSISEDPIATKSSRPQSKNQSATELSCLNNRALTTIDQEPSHPATTSAADPHAVDSSHSIMQMPPKSSTTSTIIAASIDSRTSLPNLTEDGKKRQQQMQTSPSRNNNSNAKPTEHA